MTIKVEVKTHYGVEHIYVVSPEVRKHISWMTRKLTLNRGDIESLRWLGLEVETINQVSV